MTLLKFLSGTYLYQGHVHQLDADEIVNAPLSCYIVKWRNRKVAITGLVQRSNKARAREREMGVVYVPEE